MSFNFGELWLRTSPKYRCDLNKLKNKIVVNFYLESISSTWILYFKVDHHIIENGGHFHENYFIFLSLGEIKIELWPIVAFKSQMELWK